MYSAVVLSVFAILVLIVHPAALEAYEDIPITPVTRPQNTKSCKTVVQETMKQVLQHCDNQQQQGVVDVPTSSPHLSFPRLVTPTTPPAVYNPLGRPLYPQQFPPTPAPGIYTPPTAIALPQTTAQAPSMVQFMG